MWSSPYLPRLKSLWFFPIFNCGHRDSQKVWLLALGGNFSRQRTHQSSLSCIQLGNRSWSWRERKKKYIGAFSPLHHSSSNSIPFQASVALTGCISLHYISSAEQRFVTVLVIKWKMGGNCHSESERLVITDIQFKVWMVDWEKNCKVGF